MSINLTIYSDYIWPYCYIGKGLVDTLKREFEITEKWLPFEIHPETPASGVPLAQRFPGWDIPKVVSQLNHRGQELGVTFGPLTLMSNSRQALMAGEFARAEGQFEAMHEALFQAYFTHGKDIGLRSVLLEAAASSGLDQAKLNEALDQGTYLLILEQTSRTAQAEGIHAAPTFVLGGGARIVGAQPLESIRAALRRAQESGSGAAVEQRIG